MKRTDDRWLVSRVVLLGDREAFGRLVEAYQSPVRRFFLNMTGGDGQLSDDLAQETFLKAWLGIGSFRSAAKFSTWLYRIAFNTFHDHARSLKVTVDVRDITPPVAPAANGDLGIDLARALQTLAGDERTAMLLFFMEDKSVAAISRIMGCPEGTVKSHLHRGRAKLVKYFKHNEI